MAFKVNGSPSFFAISPAEGAKTIIYLVSLPEVANVTGEFLQVSSDYAVGAGVGRPC
jgi:hypothetical protein